MTDIMVVVFAVVFIVLSPFLIIWALNTLFGLVIAYNFYTWLSVLILGSVVVKKNKQHIKQTRIRSWDF